MKHEIKTNILKRAALLALLATLHSQTFAALEQGSDFTYQGFLSDNSAPANGVYDLQFTVYNSAGAGAAVGATTTVSDLAVSNGLFTVTVSPGPGVFDGAALWLQIAVRPGASVGDYTDITPRQPILATPYAVAAGSVAGNAVGSAELADTVALGVTNGHGRLDIYHTPAQTASITLFGDGGQISTYGDDGLEQTRLGNNSFGELRLFNSLANNSLAAHLTANSASGGLLSLRNTNAATRASLYGANSGGVLQLYQADGGLGISADGDSDGAGLIQIKSAGGFNRVALDGESDIGGGGEVSLYADNGYETVQLLGESGGNIGGSLKLSQDNGTVGALLEGESGGSGEGGALNLYNGAGDLKVRIDGDFNNASQAYFYQADGDALLSVSENSGAGNLIVYGPSGASKVIIDGDDGAGHGRVTADRFHVNVNMGIARIPTANALEVQGNASKSVAGSWLANSDARIKTDVKLLSGALETLSRVRLVNFRYTDDYRKTHSDIADHRYLNVIAQEFREIFPDHVKSSGEKLPDGSEILQVDTYPLTIYSAAAVQELHGQLKRKQTEIEELKTIVAALNRTVKTIEARMDRDTK
jgi:hypothetical protein